MRKHNILNKVDNQLRFMQHGTKSMQHERSRVMHSIINDLAALRLIKPIESLSRNDIESLVEHWKNSGQSPANMINKMGIFRRFCRTSDICIDIPTNIEMGIKKVSMADEFRDFDFSETLNQCQNSITRSLVMLQALFGLTYFEAKKIDLSWSIQEDNLFVPRKIAYNHKDRLIPITTTEQKSFLNNPPHFSVHEECIIDIKPQKYVDGVYEYELGEDLANDRRVLRRHYAKTRLESISNQDTNLAIKLIQYEMGYATPGKVQELLS